MQFHDTVVMDGVRRTRDGYLTGTAKIARTGIQEYRAGEIGLTDRDPGDVIRVYRPPEAVFDEAAMAGLAHRPVTNDHPKDQVTAANWKKLAVGFIGGDVGQEGKFIRVPLALMDAEAIADFEAGKAELSVGYTCELTMKDGQTPEGEAYDAVQSDIKPNHLALCWKARGGPELRLGDGGKPANGETPMATKTMTVDGIPVEVTDAAEAVINKLQGQMTTLATAKDTADKSVAELTTTVASRDAEIVTLKKSIEDGKLTPAKLRDAARAYARTVTDAKLLAPTVTIGDDMDEPAIRKAVVSSKLGDAAKNWTDAQVEVSFNTLAAGLTDAQRKSADADPLAAVIADGAGKTADADKAVSDARAAYLADLVAGKAA